MSHRMKLARAYFLAGCVLGLVSYATAQPLGQPDRGSPGDEMVQAYLAREAAKIESRFADDIVSREAWEAKRPQYAAEYADMLGLSPPPEKTPLQATVTGTLPRDGYVVEMLHYQSWPGLYVTGNLYKPADVKAGEQRPAIFYVCGHSGRGRDGNKVAYQSHGIWFARHGYVCLIVDTLQLGEIPGIHHGTYGGDRAGRAARWWWHSRGYTPAGVEAWNGVRGIDYLVSRPDVDPQRIGVTGISGGGAATFWIAAADDRVRAAAPVSGMADLESYVPNRVINGHCDCMFLHNSHRWPWTRIAGMIAPRPLLFVNSDRDSIFPMDANDRISNRLERLYSLYGAGDVVDVVVSVGGHAYRKDIRQAVFRFMNVHLKGDAREVTDSEVDLVSEGGNPGPYPIAPQQLRVFPTDADLPRDQLNTTIDERFVPIGAVPVPAAGESEAWRKELLGRLRSDCFGYFPNDIPAAIKLGAVTANEDTTERLQSEDGIEFRIRFLSATATPPPKSIVLIVLNDNEASQKPEWASQAVNGEQAVVFCEPRGMGATAWTRKNPPNYVERSHVLLGRTVDAGRVWDVIAAAKYLSRRLGNGNGPLPVHVAGRGAASLIAAYAAVLHDRIEAVTAASPPTTHMAEGAPQFLNVLRIGDVPDILGLLAPRPLTIVDPNRKSFDKTSSIYAAAGAKERLTFK